MTPEQIQEVTRLRGLNLSPKQIARKLGVRPAAVTALLRQQAEDLAIARREAGELAPLVSCLINSEAAERLLNSNSQDLEFDNQLSGLAQVAVTRLDRSQYVLTTYLVDYFCLGVKDVIGPRKLNSTKHSVFIDKMYASFEGKKEITLLEAQAIVFGAVEYAKKLGLNPHSDWLKGKEHLGHPSENLPLIEFGRSGKPFFICGPYDNPDRIIAKLKETVGEGNFDYIVPSGKDLFSW